VKDKFATPDRGQKVIQVRIGDAVTESDADPEPLKKNFRVLSVAQMEGIVELVHAIHRYFFERAQEADPFVSAPSFGAYIGCCNLSVRIQLADFIHSFETF